MNFDMILAANARLSGKKRITPLLNSPFIDELVGRRTYIKAECLQHSGSFKFRGAFSAISALKIEEQQKGIIAYSSGNHAQGIAMAATMHNIKSTVIMPKDAPKIKIENTRKLGAEVILYDRYTESRERIGEKLQKKFGAVLIKPFDDPNVIAGQGTAGLEITEQAKELGIEEADLLVCCGGGGLTSGIALACSEQAKNFKVHPVEPHGYDDVARSLISGKREKNENNSNSLCDAIVTPSPGILTFPILKNYCHSGLVVSEDEVLKAMKIAFERLKIVIEPGGAVALAAALYHSDLLDSKTIVVVASGGNVDPETFAKALSFN
jgi:threonine dehydratase